MITARYLLFVGAARDGGRAEAMLRQHAVIFHGAEAEVEVISVHADPDRADRHRVIATPLIVRELPLPQRRLVGVPADVAELGELLGEPHQLLRDGEAS